MHWARDAPQKGLIGMVQANDFYAIADLDIGTYQLAKGLWRAASRWSETSDYVKYMQKRPRRSW
jgi:hypothetical protein